MFPNVKYCYFSWVSVAEWDSEKYKKWKVDNIFPLNISPLTYSEIESQDTGVWWPGSNGGYKPDFGIKEFSGKYICTFITLHQTDDINLQSLIGLSLIASINCVYWRRGTMQQRGINKIWSALTKGNGNGSLIKALTKAQPSKQEKVRSYYRERRENC